MLRLGIIVIVGLCLALVASCELLKPIQPVSDVASITITPSSDSLLVGDSVQLTATVVMSNGQSPPSVSWLSASSAVASVSGLGLVRGISPGVATITATSGGKSASAPITVSLVTVASVTVSPASAAIRVAGKVRLAATVRDGAGNVLSGRAIAWSSNAQGVATVSASGLVTGVAPGSATITATSEGKSGTASVGVSLAPVATVTVSPTSAAIRVAGTAQLAATTKDSMGNVLTGRAIAWSSNAPGLVTVDQNGRVTGVALGQATITATSEGKSGTAVVTVSGSGGFGHVIIVAEENHDYSQVIGNSAMPYLNGLSNQYGLATGYYANAHPSMGNYFELTTGDTIINDDNFTGTVSQDNIVRELVAAGKSWKAYIEGYPNYDANHVPVSYFSDVRNNPAQAAKMVPFTQFATDLANGT
ncbi:MAG TPA: Ig-like domain-containing protein, partial [Gemmatimonadales bacterium]|nr:Ig-like domain-containing protein [Gemmatimonadales bacterium]